MRYGARMRIDCIDFTSRPRRGKPITCAACALREGRLSLDELLQWDDFGGFEAALQRPGPWVAGIDFPFGQARRLIGDHGWSTTWDGYVAHAAALGPAGFRAVLDGYRAGQPPVDKEHRRVTDRAAGAISP
jgi:hypothetical protein